MYAPSYDAQAIARTLQDLIAIRSLSGEETALSDCLQGFLQRARVPVQRDAQDDLVAVVEPERPGDPARTTLVFSGHLDTVPPGADWAGDPLTPRVEGAGEDQRIVGLGATDMKSGLAVMAHLAARLASSAERLKRLRVAFCFTACEERSAAGRSNGVHEVLKRLRGRWAVTVEASCDAAGPTLALGCQGHALVRAGFRGQAAHSAAPESGRNAIHAAALFAARVAELHARFPEAPVYGPLKARAAAAVTLISGGRAHNVIPDRCEVTVSRRTVPGESLAEVERELLALDPRLEGVAMACHAESDGPACVVDLNGPLFRAATAASQQLFGRVRYTWNRARTDLVLFKRAGLDVLNAGPGQIGQAHAANEWVRVVDLARAAALLEEICRELDGELEKEAGG